MGYTTDFYGQLNITPPLKAEQVKYINLLGHTMRMKRDIKVLWDLYKGEHGNPFPTEKTPIRIYGHEGEFFAREDGNYGQTEDKSILDYNTPPGQMLSQGLENFNKVWNVNQARIQGLNCQPGLWCQWEVSENGEILQWDGGEKFYNYIEWLKYLIDRFFKPWGVKLNGEIEWKGEDTDDIGKIVVKDNMVKAGRGVITYPELED